MRALSARAAVASRHGEREEAFALLRRASAEPAVYAGYGVMTVLTLIDRCVEFGEPERANAPIWGADGARRLPEMAEDLAGVVYDPEFRSERQELVRRHRAWAASATVPDVADATVALAEQHDADMRRAYVNHVSARWAAPSVADATARLGKLVPLTLFDSTALDAVLARLVACSAARLSNPQMEELLELVGRKLTTGRPWHFGQWR
jgi:hypothetical protein